MELFINLKSTENSQVDLELENSAKYLIFETVSFRTKLAT